MKIMISCAIVRMVCSSGCRCTHLEGQVQPWACGNHKQPCNDCVKSGSACGPTCQQMQTWVPVVQGDLLLLHCADGQPLGFPNCWSEFMSSELANCRDCSRKLLASWSEAGTSEQHTLFRRLMPLCGGVEMMWNPVSSNARLTTEFPC